MHLMMLKCPSIELPRIRDFFVRCNLSNDQRVFHTHGIEKATQRLHRQLHKQCHRRPAVVGQFGTWYYCIYFTYRAFRWSPSLCMHTWYFDGGHAYRVCWCCSGLTEGCPVVDGFQVADEHLYKVGIIKTNNFLRRKTT